jgi:thiamine transporter
MFNKINIIVKTSLLTSLGIVFSFIKLFRLPFGGSITLCSSLFFALPGYIYGYKFGIVSGFCAGILYFLSDPFFINPSQFVLDYIFAFVCLGLTRIFSIKSFSNIKFSFISGYIICMLFRFVFNFISGILFFSSYTPNNFSVVGYSFVYNFSHVFIETLISVILVMYCPKKIMTEISNLN